MKRVAVAAAGAVLFAIILGATLSARGGATIDEFPVSFVLTSGTCSNLPAGTVLTGTGTEKTVTTVTTRKGVVTIQSVAHARGTAVDQESRVYVFNYSNEFLGSFDENGVFTGTMNDAFTAAGSGPSRLSNGFTSTITTDFATFFSFPDVVRSYGDPINFVNGDAHCDPL